MIDGGILDGKITFWTVNFTESKKQPHTDTTGNEWDLSPACCLAAAGSSGAAGQTQYVSRGRSQDPAGVGHGLSFTVSMDTRFPLGSSLVFCSSAGCQSNNKSV